MAKEEPKIAIWKTGHEIADTVAEALAKGFNADIRQTSRATETLLRSYQAHIAYGILRGTAEIFRAATGYDIPWFNCDRGYSNPNHYNGYYRISYKGTQAKWHEGIPRKAWDGELEPLRQGRYVLICPPTEPVCKFFNINQDKWLKSAISKANQCKFSHILRQKGDEDSLDSVLEGAAAVITFNSSVGWKALQMGIPCLSDINHSIVGSFYGETDLNQLIDKFYCKDQRIVLFEAMNAHQFKLDEIRAGKAWNLIEHYLSTYSSDGIHGNLSQQKSPPTVFAEGLKRRFQSLS